MSVEITKDKSVRRRRKNGGIKSASAGFQRGGANGRRVEIKNVKSGRAKTERGEKIIRDRITRGKVRGGKLRTEKAITNKGGHATTHMVVGSISATRGPALSGAIHPDAVVARKREGMRRLKMGFLDTKDIKGVRRKEMLEFHHLGAQPSSIPLKDAKRGRRRRRRQRGGGGGGGGRGDRRRSGGRRRNDGGGRTRGGGRRGKRGGKGDGERDGRRERRRAGGTGPMMTTRERADSSGRERRAGLMEPGLAGGTLNSETAPSDTFATAAARIKDWGARVRMDRSTKEKGENERARKRERRENRNWPKRDRAVIG